MLVDDDEMVNRVNAQMIKSLDIAEHVELCENGKIALDYLKKARGTPPVPGFINPEIILLDLNMPVLGGFGFLRSYESWFYGDQNTHIIAVPATIRDEDREDAVDFTHLVKTYVEKPINKQILLNIVQRYRDQFPD